MLSSPGWRTQNESDLRRLAEAARQPNLLELRTEAVAVAGGIDRGPRKDLCIGFSGYDVAFSPTEDLLAISGFRPDATGDVPVQLVDLASQKILQVLYCPVDAEWEARVEGRLDACWSIVFNPTGDKLIAGTRSGSLVVWDFEDAQANPKIRWRHSPTPRDVPSARCERVSRLGFDQQAQLWTGDDQTVAVWNIENVPKKIRRSPGFFTRPGPGSKPLSLETSEWSHTKHPEGNLHVRRETDKRLTICHEGVPVGRLALPEDERADDNKVSDFLIYPDGDLLVSAAEHTGHLKLWDLTGSRLLASRKMAEGSLRLTIYGGGRHVAVCESDRVALFEFQR